jgi:hypothetical protein
MTDFGRMDLTVTYFKDSERTDILWRASLSAAVDRLDNFMMSTQPRYADSSTRQATDEGLTAMFAIKNTEAAGGSDLTVEWDDVSGSYIQNVPPGGILILPSTEYVFAGYGSGLSERSKIKLIKFSRL